MSIFEFWQITIFVLFVGAAVFFSYLFSIEVGISYALGISAFIALFFLPGQYAVVIALGTFTGIVELIGRYKDSPFRALCSYGALLYVATNIIAAIAGLYLIKKIGFGFIQETDPEKRSIYEMLIAGFGSLAFLRSSIFKVRFNDTDISIGPALLLDILLASADRGVDRRRGADRAREIAEVMREVSFDKAVSTLPPFCLSLMQNLSRDEQNALFEQLAKVQTNPSIDPLAKSLLMGLLLINLVGLEVLREAVSQLGANIKNVYPQPKTRLDPSVVEALLNEAKRALKGVGPAQKGKGDPPQASSERVSSSPTAAATPLDDTGKRN